jgi:hypothetical protein
VSACVSYLEAARTAIRGLEGELDQIMIEAEQVAQYYWEKKNRAELAKRITTYLHQDKLRPILDESLSSIEKCSEFAGKDICGFFGRADQKKTHAVKLLEELYAEMHKYLVGLNKISLVGLSKTTSYTEANYPGPSGLNIPELLDLRELLKDKTTEALLTNEDTCDRRETTREGRKPCRQGSRRSRPARLRHSRQGEGGNAGTHCSVQPRSTRCPQPAGPTSNKPETADTQLTSVRSGQQRMA